MSEQTLPTSAGAIPGAGVIPGTEALSNAEARPAARAVAGRSPRGKGFDVTTLLTYAYLIAMLLFSLFPLYFVLQASLGGGQNLYTTDLTLLPKQATIDNYTYVLTQLPYLSWIWNSTFIAILTTAIGLSFAIFGGYALSRFRFRGRVGSLMFLLALQSFPGLLALPAYYTLLTLVDQWLNSTLGMTGQHVNGSLAGLVLIYAAGPLAFGCWNMKGYFDTLPVELEQAAMIDGATLTGAFIRVTLPLAAPALVTTGMFMFIGVWNEFALANFVLSISDTNQYTFPLGLNSLSSNYRTPWGQFAAASVMAAIPLMALFLYAQSFFKSGLTIGGVKG